jgi:hypothetical protein
VSRRVAIEKDSSAGCQCDATYKVVLYEGLTVVRVLGSKIKSYEVADNIRRVAEGR